MDPGRRTGAAWRWTLAGVAVVWIVSVVPSLPLPYSPWAAQLPPIWVRPLLVVGYALGSLVGMLGWAALGPSGVMEHAKDFDSLPLSARAWFTTAMLWGSIFGMFAVVQLPPWVLWVVSRIGGGKAAGPARSDPPLVVAFLWSAVLGGAFVVIVGGDLLRPEPSALMMPPFGTFNANARAPLDQWCPYSLHARAHECRAALAEAQAKKAVGNDRFAYAGARCVPLAELPRLSPEGELATHAADVLTRAIAPTATVRLYQHVGDDAVDVLVAGEDGATLLVLDVVRDPESREFDDPRAARLAAAGVPEYWRIELHPNRDPRTLDEVRFWKELDAASGRYMSVGSNGRNPDGRLRIAAFPEARVPVDELLPPPCAAPSRGGWGPTEVASKYDPDEHARLQRRERGDRVPACTGPAFVVDGSSPTSLVLGPPDADGMVKSLTFQSVSATPGAEFDPPTTGVALRIRGVYGADKPVVDVVIPPGDRWVVLRPAYRYFDPKGEHSGITEAQVMPSGEGRLRWTIRGIGPYPVPFDQFPAWTNLAVALGSPGAPAEPPCGTVFFHTDGAAPGRCPRDFTGALRCAAPGNLRSCKSDDVDGLVRCTIERAAHAEEVFFAHNGRHAIGSCENLEVAVPRGATCMMTPKANGFTVTAVHASMRTGTVCMWDSVPPPGQDSLRCS